MKDQTKIMTQQEFKTRWESDDNGGGITYEDVANCAEAWGLCRTPRTHRMERVLHKVLKAAGVADADSYLPETEENP